MTEKEKFWERYNRIDSTMFYLLEEAKKETAEAEANDLIARKEKEMRRKATSRKWAAYDLLQARYEVIEDPIERVKKLASLKELNEHDAYLANPALVFEDYQKLCKKKTELENNYEGFKKMKNIKPKNDEEEIRINQSISECETYHKQLVKKIYRLQDELEESLSDHEEYKTYKILTCNDGYVILRIERYEDKAKKKFLCQGQVPICFAARFILAHPELKKQLDNKSHYDLMTFVNTPKISY